jgi:pyrroline-5-carboxylate reductase
MSESTKKPRISRLAVLGAGKMGLTLMRAMISAGVVDRAGVVATARHAARLAHVADELDVATTLDNRQAASDAEVILLCVKPQTAQAVLAELADHLRPDQLLVSILASVSTGYIEARLNHGVPVVRAMPNTPALVGAGMTVLCAGSAASAADLELASTAFADLGRVMTLDERYFDAVTSVSASGPAFIYMVIEALAEGAVKVGLPRAVATELAAQACLGAARMVIETKDHPAVLRDAVTTPAGCTIDGILSLEEGGLRVTLIKAIVEATRRAGELVE